MAYRQDFYPTGRQDQFNLNKRWTEILQRPASGDGSGNTKWKEWGIPEPVLNEYLGAIDKAAAAFDAVIFSGLRSGPLHTAVQETFAVMEKLARNLKRRYFFSPPLTREEMDELGIKERDTVKTPAPVAKRAPLLNGSNPERHVIRVTISAPPSDGEDFRGFNRVIRVGILSRDGKTPEKTPFAAWYMSKIPGLPEELPKQLKANRKNEDITLSALESGSIACVCACYENSKGQPGPWSEIIEIVIT